MYHMAQKKQQRNYLLLLDETVKREASGKSRLMGTTLAGVIRAFLKAFARGDKRAVSIVEDSIQNH